MSLFFFFFFIFYDCEVLGLLELEEAVIEFTDPGFYFDDWTAFDRESNDGEGPIRDYFEWLNLREGTF